MTKRKKQAVIKEVSGLLGGLKKPVMIVGIMYLVFSVSILLVGMFEGGLHRNPDTQLCYVPQSRIAKMFPSFDLGCYLGQNAELEYYNYETYKKLEDQEAADLEDRAKVSLIEKLTDRVNTLENDIEALKEELKKKEIK